MNYAWSRLLNEQNDEWFELAKQQNLEWQQRCFEIIASKRSES